MKKNVFAVIFWICITVLFFVQAVFTISSTNQIRLEELAESVRSVWWFKNHEMYGVSTNIGYYAILQLLYSFFGFNLFLAKYFRLALDAASLLCLALILKKYLSEKLSILPLLAMGLSPTLLYLNTFQAQYGIDMQFLPICAYLLLTIDYKNIFVARIKQIALWFLAMLAILIYPTFLFYLPAGIALYLRQLKQGRLNNIAISIASFFAPLLILSLMISDKSQLIYNPDTQSGLFRGGGHLLLDVNLFFRNIINLVITLFDKPYGYYFELKNVEFSHLFPIAAILLTLIIAFIVVWKNKRSRFTYSLIFLTFAVTIIISGLTDDAGFSFSIRRFTPILVCFYALLIVNWYFVSKIKVRNIFVPLMVLTFAILIFHHLIVLQENLSESKKISIYAESLWLNNGTSPENSMNNYIQNILKDDIKFYCRDRMLITSCPTSTIYSAISAACEWNHLECHKMYRLNKDNKFQELNVKILRNDFLHEEVN